VIANDTQETQLEYAAALEIDPLEEIPDDFIRFDLPCATYARFRHKSDPDKIHLMFDHIFTSWLPQSNYDYAGGWEFETFHLEHDALKGEHYRYYHLPICKQNR